MNEKELFGPAAGCETLAEIIQLLKSVVGEEAKMAIVAYGMIVGARLAAGGSYFGNALEVLNGLGSAKAELDKAVNHDFDVVSVSAQILYEAQKFVDEAIPCTEWPPSAEVVSCACACAANYAFSGPWRRRILGNRGQVIGVEIFHEQ